MKKVISIIFTLCTLVSCQQIQRDLTRDAVLEMNGNFLYLDEIEQVIPSNLSIADSAEYAERYKKQWIIGNLMYEKAKENVGKSKEIEKLTEIYKRELIINKYQQQLIRPSRNASRKVFLLGKYGSTEQKPRSMRR